MSRVAKRIIVTFFVLQTALFPISIAEKYPAYAYVFSEFDVDESYIENDDFEAFAHKNMAKMKHFYERSMKRGEMLSPLVKGYLMDQGLSDLFIYLSMIESGFSTDIVSSKKAVGLWQFMPATAQHYNLQVCNSFDERCDPVSATSAAITYLYKLYGQFGKWYLAAIAYNCGEGRLQRAIDAAGSDELGILTDERQKYLPSETRNYIRKILLVAMIGEGKYIDVSVGSEHNDDKLYRVKVSGGTNLEKVAQMLDMKPEELLRLNRQFKKGITPRLKARCSIMIPEEKMMLFYLRYEFRKETKSFKPNLLSHVVQMGDTVESIAKKYHSSVQEIKTANKLDDEFLELDTVLLVPVSRNTFEETLRESGKQR